MGRGRQWQTLRNRAKLRDRRRRVRELDLCDWNSHGGAGADCCPCGAVEDCCSAGNTDADESSAAVVTSVISGAEVAGSWGTPPNPGKPNWGYPCWPSMAVSLAPWADS